MTAKVLKEFDFTKGTFCEDAFGEDVCDLLSEVVCVRTTFFTATDSPESLFAALMSVGSRERITRQFHMHPVPILL